MGKFQETCQKDGWKDGKTATTKGSRNTATITEDLKIIIRVKILDN